MWEPPALSTCTDSLGCIPRSWLLDVKAPAERLTPNLSTPPYLRRGTVGEGELSRGRGPVARALSRPSRRSPAGGGAPAAPRPSGVAELPPLRALGEPRWGCECFVKPALPSLFLSLLFPYLCWHLTWKAACGARAPRRERPRPRAERTGPGGCGGTAAQGGRPAGPSVSLLVRQRGEIHQSGPKDGLRVPCEGQRPPGSRQGSADGHRARTGQSPASPALRAPGLKLPRFPIPAALPTCTAQPRHYSPPSVGGGAAPPIRPGFLAPGFSALPQRPGRQPQPSPSARRRDLHGDITGRLSCGSQQPSSRAAALSASGPLPRRLLAKVIAPCPPLFPARADPLLLRRDASPTPRRGGTCLSLCTSRGNFGAEGIRPRGGQGPPRPLPGPRSQVAAPARPRGLARPTALRGQDGPGSRRRGPEQSLPRGAAPRDRRALLGTGVAAGTPPPATPGQALPGRHHGTFQADTVVPPPARWLGARPGLCSPQAPVRRWWPQAQSHPQRTRATCEKIPCWGHCPCGSQRAGRVAPRGIPGAAGPWGQAHPAHPPHCRGKCT